VFMVNAAGTVVAVNKRERRSAMPSRRWSEAAPVSSSHREASPDGWLRPGPDNGNADAGNHGPHRRGRRLLKWTDSRGRRWAGPGDGADARHCRPQKLEQQLQTYREELERSGSGRGKSRKPSHTWKICSRTRMT
jgi:hypothetical protein